MAKINKPDVSGSKNGKGIRLNGNGYSVRPGVNLIVTTPASTIVLTGDGIPFGVRT